MAVESNKVLSSFTRQLANCKGNVSVKNLIQYFSEGKYGYVVENGIPTVITNDYAFADDIANLVTHLRAIFKKPRLFLKKENIIQNTSVATKMSVESMQATYRDDKNWKMLDGEPQPELVHTFTYEDNYAIYENRFICALIDAVYDIVSKKINQLCWNFDTLNGQINYQKDTPFNSAEFIQFVDNQGEIPTLAVNDSPEVNVIGLLIKSKKRLQSLRNKELYIQCKKAEKFSLKSVKSTNILTFDADYNFCYNFYVNYLFREPTLATPKQMYLNFVTVNLFRAITLCGYNLVNDDTGVSVSNSVKLRFDEVAFANDLFTITVCPTQDDNLLLKVKANPDFNESHFLVVVADKESIEETKLFDNISDYAKSLNVDKDESFTRVFLVNDYAQTQVVNAFYVEPAYANAVKRLQDLVKNCTMLAEGSFYVHSRICPVCGSNLVAPDGNDYTCAYCESTYHMFGFGAKMYLWLKILPDVESNPKAKRKNKYAKHAPVHVRLRIERTDNEDDFVLALVDEEGSTDNQLILEEAGIDVLPAPLEEEYVEETVNETDEVALLVEEFEDTVVETTEDIAEEPQPIVEETSQPVENVANEDTNGIKPVEEETTQSNALRIRMRVQPKTERIGKGVLKRK